MTVSFSANGTYYKIEKEGNEQIMTICNGNHESSFLFHHVEIDEYGYLIFMDVHDDGFYMLHIKEIELETVCRY